MPTNIRATAVYTSAPDVPPRSAAAMASVAVEPVAPNISATPYKKNAVANEPSRKYFSDDSLLEASLRRNPARMYVAIEDISRPMKIRTNSTADDITVMPTTPNRIRAKYSLARMRCTAKYSNELRMTTAAITMTRESKKTLKVSILIVLENANPGNCAIYQVAASATSVPMKAIPPRVFWPFSSSINGSSSMITMPKAESTNSGRMRM